MFTNKASTSDTSIRPSQLGFGKAILPKSDLAHHRQSPTVLSPPMAGPGPLRPPMGDPTMPSIPARPASFPRPPVNPGIRAGLQPADTCKVKQTGEMLQNLMLRQQKPPGSKAPPPGPNHPPSPALTPAATPSPIPRQQPRQKTSAEVTPLRRPLPPDGALPLKPRRPPNVNLKPFLRFKHGSSLPDQRQRNGESCLFTDGHPVDVEGDVPTLPHVSNISTAHLKI